MFASVEIFIFLLTGIVWLPKSHLLFRGTSAEYGI